MSKYFKITLISFLLILFLFFIIFGKSISIDYNVLTNNTVKVSIYDYYFSNIKFTKRITEINHYENSTLIKVEIDNKIYKVRIFDDDNYVYRCFYLKRNNMMEFIGENNILIYSKKNINKLYLILSQPDTKFVKSLSLYEFSKKGEYNHYLCELSKKINIHDSISFDESLITNIEYVDKGEINFHIVKDLMYNNKLESFKRNAQSIHSVFFDFNNEDYLDSILSDFIQLSED